MTDLQELKTTAPKINQWVVLELTPKAEGEDPELIKNSIRRIIPKAEVFIPASTTKKGIIKEVHYLMEGYAFVRRDQEDHIYFRLDDTRYITQVLKMPGNNRREKKVSVVSDRDIDKFRTQIEDTVNQGIGIDDEVEIISGQYKNMLAEVQQDIQETEQVVVLVKGFRSTVRLITLPRAFLRLKSKSKVVAIASKFQSLKDWAENAITLAAAKTPNSLSSIRVAAKMLEKLQLAQEKQLEIDILKGQYPKPKSLRQSFNLIQGMETAISHQEQLKIKVQTPSVKPVIQEYARVLTLENWRLGVKWCREYIVNAKKGFPVNLVIDGTQLYIRCLEVPGLSGLTDDQGRPTGAIMGFLRALSSYKKRFQDSEIYVCWDGSSQRRRNLFPEYKAGRTQRSNNWSFIKEILPHFGVHQAHNDQEEADDVMATLVRKTFAGQPNVMITTDRDLLQCCSEFTQQLCPANGGKEKIYTPETVLEEYGVPPNQMVQLRSLSGDTSDNIPGVLGFGVKTAAKALVPYGTIEGLLRSNMVGLTKRQVDNLKQASKQIRLNTQLMELQTLNSINIKDGSFNEEAATQMLNSMQIKSETLLPPFRAQ